MQAWRPEGLYKSRELRSVLCWPTHNSADSQWRREGTSVSGYKTLAMDEGVKSRGWNHVTPWRASVGSVRSFTTFQSSYSCNRTKDFGFMTITQAPSYDLECHVAGEKEKQVFFSWVLEKTIFLTNNSSPSSIMSTFRRLLLKCISRVTVCYRVFGDEQNNFFPSLIHHPTMTVVFVVFCV